MTGTPPADAADALAARLVQLGLEGAHFTTILDTFCKGVRAAGVPLLRAHVTLRTIHPEFGSIAHRWLRDEGVVSQTFAYTTSPRDQWVTSPLYYLLENDISEIRQRLTDPEPALNFPYFDELRASGGTDYVAFKTVFGKAAGTLAVDPNNSPEGCLMSMTSDAAEGFTETNLTYLRAILPSLQLALKAGANRQMAEDIAATYLGRDAGSRVISGDILRGSVETMDAVICYFDLSGFTTLSEALSGDEIIDMLNDYFGVAVEVVQQHGGNVLKFMGDGMLSIFNVAKVDNANRSAVEATVALRMAMADVNGRRQDAKLATAGFTLALHRGEVLYGNIGGKTRLDFTVIGPAVNTAARLSGMCAHVGQTIVISANVARPLLGKRRDLVSLGQYRLRGVADRQELFTLD